MKVTKWKVYNPHNGTSQTQLPHNQAPIDLNTSKLSIGGPVQDDQVNGHVEVPLQFVDEGEETPRTGSNFLFIDERARQQPKSTLRTAVRSYARSFSHKSAAKSRLKVRSTPNRRLLTKPPAIPSSQGSGNEPIPSIELLENKAPKTQSLRTKVKNQSIRNRLPRLPSKKPSTHHSSIIPTPKPLDSKRTTPASQRKFPGYPKLQRIGSPKSAQGNATPGKLRPKSYRRPSMSLVIGKTSPEPQTILGAGRVDPFATYPIEAKPYVHYLVDYYTTVCAPPFPKADNDEFSSLRTKWLPLCMTNAIAFKSILLIAETKRRAFAGLHPWSQYAFTLAVECVRGLNEELARPNQEICDAMFAIVIHLGGLELVNGEYGKYQTHMKGLLGMVKIRGGFNNLGSHTKEMIIWINQLGSMVFTSTTPEPRNASMSRDVPLGLTRDSNAVLTNEDEPASILPDLVPLMTNIKYLSTYPHATEGDNQCNGPRQASHDLRNQLLHLHKSKTNISNIDKSSLLATITYLDFILLDIPPHKVLVSETARQLQQGLTHPRSEKEIQENGVLLEWISITAASCMGFDGDYKTRLVRSFEEVLKQLERRFEDGEEG